MKLSSLVSCVHLPPRLSRYNIPSNTRLSHYNIPSNTEKLTWMLMHHNDSHISPNIYITMEEKVVRRSTNKEKLKIDRCCP